MAASWTVPQRFLGIVQGGCVLPNQSQQPAQRSRVCFRVHVSLVEDLVPTSQLFGTTFNTLSLILARAWNDLSTLLVCVPQR
jgi:hypothetical protein